MGSRSNWTDDEADLLGRVRESWHPRLVPPLIRGYELGAEIGRGGQGVVYRAIQLSTGREVAVKVLDPEVSNRRDRRFALGLELAATLRHPNIATVHDRGQTEDGRPFLAMELVEGTPLAALGPVGRPGPLARLESALAVFRQIVAAVAHAHQRGVIHRDLKPGNVILDPSGRPLVIDFGLARPVDGAALLGGATRTGEMLGSLAWAAPEQLEGRRDEVDTRADVYALGGILFHLLTGEPPRRAAGSVTATLRRLTAATAPDLRARRQAAEEAHGLPRLRLPADLVAICDRALAPDPADRYPTAEQLGEDLDRFGAGAPVTVLRHRRGYVLWKAIRRHKLRTAAVAAAVLVLAGSSLFFSWQRDLARAQAEERAALLAGLLDTYQVVLRTAVDGTVRLAGAGPMRRELVDAAYASFADFHRRFPEEREVRFLLAQILDRRASIARRRGETDLSRRLQLEALGHHRDLAAADPERTEWQEALALNLVKIGDLDKEAGRIEPALERYREALRIDQALSDRHPRDPHLLDNLFWDHHRLAMVALESGLADPAPHFARLRPLADRALALDPNRTSSLALRYQANHALQAWAEARGDDEEAIRLARIAAADARELVAREPGRTNYLQKLLLAQRGLASALTGNGRPAAALVQLDQALATAEHLVEAEPEVLDFVHDLELTRLVRARLMIELGRLDLAEQEVAAVAELADRLAAAGKDNFDYASTPAVARSLRAELRLAQGRREEAAADARAALRILRESSLEGPRSDRLERNFTALLAAAGYGASSDGTPSGG